MKDSNLVSVVVRAYNEKDNITNCLESLLNQTQPFHLIIVDNASTDGTQDSIKNFLDKNPQLYAGVIYEPKKGRGNALQRGIDSSHADIVVCLDGDSFTTQTDWLERLVFPLVNNQSIIATSGRIKFYDGPYHHKLLYDTIRSSVYFISSFIGQGWLSLANCAFRKSAFNEVGGTSDLDGNYPEDRILALKLRSKGKIAYVHKAQVYTHNWLLDKKTWTTHLIDELDCIRELVNVPESYFHSVVRHVSFLCAQWDKIKLQILNYL